MGSAIVIGPFMLAVDRGLAVLCADVFLDVTALAGRFPSRRVRRSRPLRFGELSDPGPTDGIDMARRHS